MKKNIIIFFFIMIPLFVNGYPAGKVVIEDLSDDWLIYDNDYTTYIPYTGGRDIDKLHLYLDNSFKGYKLTFLSYPDLSVFINQSVLYTHQNEGKKWVSMQIPGDIEVPYLLTFYNRKGWLPRDSVFFGSESEHVSVEEESEPFTAYRRDNNKQPVLPLLVLYLFGFVIIVLKARYPTNMIQVLQVRKFLPEMSRDDSLLPRFYDPFTILATLVISMSVTYIFALMQQSGTPLPLLSFDLWSWSGFLIATLYVFAVFFMRYIFLNVFSWIFDLRPIDKVQYFETIKVLIKGLIVLVPLISLWYYGRYNSQYALPFEIPSIPYMFIIYFLLGLFVVILVRVWFLIFQFRAFRNIYLFSYLCITEILPILVLTGIFLFLNYY